MIIAFMNQKGGVGKSTISVHFAVFHHERGRRVFFIDADAQESSTKWLEDGGFGIDFARLTDPDDIMDAASMKAETYDFVVIDGPGGSKDTNRAVCLVADVMVLPTQPYHLDLLSSQETIRVFKNSQRSRGVGLPCPVLVLNKLGRKNYTLTREAVEATSHLGIPACKASMTQREAFAEAAGQGKVVWSMGYAARIAAKEIIKVIEEITCYGNDEVPKTLSERETLRGREEVPGERAATTP